MKCSRCGGTEQVQRTLMPEVPALCIRCIESDRAREEDVGLGMDDLFSHQQIVENRLW